MTKILLKDSIFFLLYAAIKDSKVLNIKEIILYLEFLVNYNDKDFILELDNCEDLLFIIILVILLNYIFSKFYIKRNTQFYNSMLKYTSNKRNTSLIKLIKKK